jgi:predicted ABC-type sugar transport system permease subunit
VRDWVPYLVVLAAVAVVVVAYLFLSRPTIGGAG